MPQTYPIEFAVGLGRSLFLSSLKRIAHFLGMDFEQYAIDCNSEKIGIST